MNENWPRWIIASVNEHFSSVINSATGEPDTETELQETVELRVNGPYIKELHEEHEITISVNLIVQSVSSDIDYHKIHKKVGEVLVKFTGITVYKYGDNVGDDDSVVGCFGKPDEIQVNYFGQIEPRLPLQQASVSAEYVMYL